MPSRAGSRLAPDVVSEGYTVSGTYLLQDHARNPQPPVQEHETEYGTHWNFFMTLGIVPVLQVFLHPFMIYLPVSVLGILLAIGMSVPLATG